MYLHVDIFILSLPPENKDTSRSVQECGEIWLLATTLKNAKIINVLCFCDGSAFLWGLFYASAQMNQKKNIEQYELLIYI